MSTAELKLNGTTIISESGGTADLHNLGTVDTTGLRINGTTIISESGGTATLQNTTIDSGVSFESIPFGWERFSPGSRELLFHAWTSVTNVSGSATLTEEEAPLNSFALVYVHASGGGYSDGSGNMDIYNTHTRYYAQKAPVSHYASPRTQGLFPILDASDRTIYWTARVHSIQALNEFIVYYVGYIKLGG